MRLATLLNREYIRVGLASASARRKRWSKSHARITPGSIHSPSPFRPQIYPRRHMANFGEINGEELPDFARILRDIVGRFYFGLENPDFTYSIRNAPVASADINYYHWCLNIVPNLPIPSFEKEGKMFLNPVLPEEAAQFADFPKRPNGGVDFRAWQWRRSALPSSRPAPAFP